MASRGVQDLRIAFFWGGHFIFSYELFCAYVLRRSYPALRGGFVILSRTWRRRPSGSRGVTMLMMMFDRLQAMYGLAQDITALN